MVGIFKNVWITGVFPAILPSIIRALFAAREQKKQLIDISFQSF